VNRMLSLKEMKKAYNRKREHGMARYSSKP
jgi:hypothetical protein